MYIMCKKYKLQVSESSFSKTLKITFRTEGYFSTLAKFIPICNGNFFMWLQILPFERVWNPEITITYWNASFRSNEYFCNLTFSYKPYLTIWKIAISDINIFCQHKEITFIWELFIFVEENNRLWCPEMNKFWYL